ncbi:hypothetical protein HYH02_006840 [Chlamydomonas schloesseri]|uniref:Uncharacterized protein n=1 Tax=Chlamydomonas schloesseri TaxID=2026947 RepID=A0A835WIX2_9CHLO|nr:hypothetical protein HYH02_006840 [Chlamydomonas schloesseri]|eukprot:KAG2448256.1 hypothetical protein HYH02_006840 [Chlamydomonas schloesseri]
MSGREGTLRFQLAFSDGTAPAYWKHDGERFAKKEGKSYDPLTLCSTAGTLKLCSGKTYQLSLTSNQPVYLREGSGRWYTREFDANGKPILPPATGIATATASPIAAEDGEQAPAEPGTEPGLGLGPAPGATPAAAGGGDAEHASSSGPSAAGVVAGGGRSVFQELTWTDDSKDATRSTFKATLHLSEEAMRPTKSNRRLYLMVAANVEEFGWVVCPLQVKIYHRADRSATRPFPLKFVQYDFRADSSMRASLMGTCYHKYGG